MGYDPRWHGTEVSARGVIHSTDQISAYPAELADSIDWQAVEDIDIWLDRDRSAEYQAQPLAQDWARTCKVIEELGEAIEQLIRFTGQNPRKPSTDPAAERAEFLAEMADTVFTAILCMQHFTKDTREVQRILRERLTRISLRVTTPGS